MMTSGIPFLFGWAKPVPFNPRNLRDIRRDPAWIGLAGPGANLLLAVTAAIVLRVLVLVLGMPASLEMLRENPLTWIAFTMVMINLALMVFNMIPVPPLDGSHLLHAVLPPQGQRVLEQIGPFGILIAILLANRILVVPLSLLMYAVLAFAFWGQ
jgi:Zn-dependent protease